MKNVVVIGGGTGQSIILRGMKQLENINLSAIVTVADDGDIVVRAGALAGKESGTFVNGV